MPGAVLIDFTRPEGTQAHLQACRRRGVKMVIGTTGFDEAGKAAIATAADSIAIVFAPNMSVGVNGAFRLLEVAASILAAGYDIEVIEAHHRHKVDAPSGTALKMGEVIAGAQGKALKELAVYAREGVTGERKAGTHRFRRRPRRRHRRRSHRAVRRHRRTHRDHPPRRQPHAYALGSMRAARFIAGKPRGLFDMHDVLGLK